MRFFEYLKLKKKLLFVLLGSLFSLVVVFAGTYYVARVRNEAAKSKAAGNVSLYFDPQSPTVSVNSDFSLKVKINPGSEKVTAIELYLSFDKDRIKVEKIESTPAFPTVLIAPLIDNNQGRVSVVVAILLQEGSPPIPVTEISDVVLVKAKTKGTPGIALLKISQDSMAAAIGKDSNVIGTYGEASVNIIPLPTSTPTATPTPKPTATPTPTPTPTATPTATPTGIATPTATPTSTPTSTPTGSPTATPTVTPATTPTPTPTGEGLAGDVDGNECVNGGDLVIILDNYGLTVPPGDPRANLTAGDTVIDGGDLVIVIENYNPDAPVCNP